MIAIHIHNLTRRVSQKLHSPTDPIRDSTNDSRDACNLLTVFLCSACERMSASVHVSRWLESTAVTACHGKACRGFSIGPCSHIFNDPPSFSFSLSYGTAKNIPLNGTISVCGQMQLYQDVPKLEVQYVTSSVWKCRSNDVQDFKWEPFQSAFSPMMTLSCHQFTLYSLSNAREEDGCEGVDGVCPPRGEPVGIDFNFIFYFLRPRGLE